MKEYKIPKAESGQKLIRFLNRILPGASNGFLFKMLRKKNITLNEKKASGNESLSEGDLIKIFFSDQTFEKFSNEMTDADDDMSGYYMSLDTSGLNIIYESDDYIVADKKPGLLSQKAKDDDISINELLISYMFKNNELSDETYRIFKPSVINRLDRNTSGLILFGKSMKGLKDGAELVKSHESKKTYYCIVKGRYDGPGIMEGFLKKDSKSNIISYSDKELPDSKYMKQEVHLEKTFSDYSLLKIRLYTGRSHQIRASLAANGFPIVGDLKYGNQKINELAKEKANIKRPLLHSFSMLIEGKTVKCSIPSDFTLFIEKFE